MTWIEAVNVLELHRYQEIDQAAVMRAYRSRALETHPDLGGESDAFKRVDEAKRLLSDLLARGITITRKSRESNVRPVDVTPFTHTVWAWQEPSNTASFVTVFPHSF